MEMMRFYTERPFWEWEGYQRRTSSTATVTKNNFRID